jgi:hypothetical protein
LVHEQKATEKKIGHVNEAIALGNPPASLLAKLRTLEIRQAEIGATLADLRPVPRLAREVLEDRLAEWRRLVRGSPTQARAVIQRVIKGRITFTPDEAGYVFSAPTRFSKLFSGIVAPRPSWLPEGDVRGTEHLTPEDTFDADYGRLLDRAAKRVEGGTSPMGFEPMFRP